MALTDPTTGNIIRDYSIEEPKDAANLMRGYDLVALKAAESMAFKKKRAEENRGRARASLIRGQALSVDTYG